MANKVRHIFANMSWLMVSQIINSVLAFIWTLIIARYLSVSDYGIFGTANSFIVFFGVLADFGICSYLVREIAIDFDSENEYMNTALSLKVFLCIFYMSTIIISMIILGYDSYLFTISLLFAIENLFKTFFLLMFSSFQAHEMMKYQAIANIILSVWSFILVVAVTFTDYGLYGIVVAFILANAFTLIYSSYILFKYYVDYKWVFDLKQYKHLIISGLPFALTSVFYIIYYSIDMVMLNQLNGAYITGLYNSAYKLISVLTLFYTVYSSVIYPVMSKLFKDADLLLHFSFNKSIKYLLLVTIPLSIATLFYSSDVIILCFGTQYVEAAPVLQILIWTVSFLFANGACSMLLNSSHKEVSVTKVYFFAAIFNILLNLILIPRYSVYGAAFATVLSEIFILILELYMISRINQLPNNHLVHDLLKIIVASIIMGIVLYYLQLSVWLAIPVGIIVYFAVFILIRGLDDDDKLIIGQIIGKRI